MAAFVVALSHPQFSSSRGPAILKAVKERQTAALSHNLGCLLVIWMSNVLLAFLQMHPLLPGTNYNVHGSVQFNPFPCIKAEKIILSLTMSLAVCIAQIFLSRSIVQ